MNGPTGRYAPGALAAAALLVGTAAPSVAAAPPNAPAQVRFDPASGRLSLLYNGADILQGRVTVVYSDVKPRKREAPKALLAASSIAIHTGQQDAIEQRITLAIAQPVGARIVLQGAAPIGGDLMAMESLSPAQERFRLIRTTVGRSDNGRNNALYDRDADWNLEGPVDGGTRIAPLSVGYALRASSKPGEPLTLTFRPRFYQKHKNIPSFEPWNYTVWKGSVTGWCSWWAYFGQIDETDIAAVVDVFSRRGLKDYGYRYIQIDDGFEQTPRGPADHWLNWRADTFPGGLDNYARRIRAAGLEPAVWLSVGCDDAALVAAHPDWFVPGADGKPHRGPWIEWAVDATNPAAMDALVRPVYRRLKAEGVTYVKIDTLRHLLYDGYYHVPAGRFHDPAVGAEEAFRAYLQVARDEMGRNTFLLSCWGVLPETAGIADGCRLGTDGFGPATLQQYNSWNGIVWRSDPDHCDILPFREFKGTRADTVIRPTLVSMAGGMLLLSDRPEVYADPANLEGAKRASPILFSVPGQLYDYDPRKSDALRALVGMHRAEGGGPPSPVDADQFSPACEWWLNEIDRPFERWNVLGRLAWDQPLKEAQVHFADLGLDPEHDYAVYEFWTRRYLGVFRGWFPVAAQDAKSVRNYAIRAALARPQVLSTSRHISQGAVDLEAVRWNARTRTLSGRSEVIHGDPYTLTLRIPAEFEVLSARWNGQPMQILRSGETGALTVEPAATGPVRWEIGFKLSQPGESGVRSAPSRRR